MPWGQQCGEGTSLGPGACVAAFSAQNYLYPHLLHKEKGNFYLVYSILEFWRFTVIHIHLMM